MTTTDVDSNAGNASESRFTNHIFDLSLQSICGPPGQAIRVPHNDAERSEWPPSSLFDATYASTVMSHFGATPDGLFETWELVFYEPNGASKAGQTDDQRRHDQDDAQKENHEKQKAERKQCYDERLQGRRGRRDGGLDGLDMLMILPFIAMAPEDARDYLQGCQKIAAAKKREELKIKVNSWREGL